MTESGSVRITPVKGRPMLTWVGKRPLSRVTAFPAQHVEIFDPSDDVARRAGEHDMWADWPDRYPRGGLLFHGDNKEVLAHLLANGFRGRIKLIYIDPPFDSGADYVRKVQLRGHSGSAVMEGEGYSLGEQIQYHDIWQNDEYLQFMYERLLLLKELLADGGSIWLHCDWHRSHHLRCLMDEVFGDASFKNEVIWQRTDPHNDARTRIGWIHDTLFWYAKGENYTYNYEAVAEPLSEAALKEYNLIKLWSGEVVDYKPELEGQGRRFKLDDCTYKGNDPTRRFEWRGARPSDKRVWPYGSPKEMDAALERGEFYLRNPSKGAARCRVSYLDEREGQLLQSIWTGCGRMKGGVEFPTEKPDALLARIIQGWSNPGDIVLDCFVGSGTTAIVAQKLGRRWIGCDINKGAIQITSKRLQVMIQQQLTDLGYRQQKLIDSKDSPPEPAQLSFTVWRVNDYDLQIQHNEAINLACEHIGIQRTHADSFFEGTLGRNLVKIIPFDHPLSPLDLDEIRRELEARPHEDRNVTVVCLGKELAADAWIEDWNRLRRGAGAVNRIEVIELRTDARYGKFFIHKPASAKVKVSRENGRLLVEIQDFVSPTIIERLSQQSGVLTPVIEDWRAMVDCVMIDPAYDGKVFNIALSDIPEKKDDLVSGTYTLPAPDSETTVAVKIIDMLGEEVLELHRV